MAISIMILILIIKRCLPINWLEDSNEQLKNAKKRLDQRIKENADSISPRIQKSKNRDNDKEKDF